MSETRRTAIAAAVILLGFGLVAWFLPDIMRLAASVSPWVAGLVVVVFLLGFFAIFWARARYKDR